MLQFGLWSVPKRMGEARCAGLFTAAVFVLAIARVGCAGEFEDAQSLFLAGNYKQCVAKAEPAARRSPASEDWQLLLCESLLALGEYPRAEKAMTEALARNTESLQLRWLAREVFQSNGHPEKGSQAVDDLLRLVSARPTSFRDPADLVAFGRAALLRGADPKRVIDRAYAAAKQANPPAREAWIASGELSLEKHDFDLAARQFQEGLKKFPEDPDLHFGLARAYVESRPALASASIEEALKRNSNHVGCLLLIADHQIDAEQYSEALKTLERISRINPWHPDAWAYRTVIAHLQNRPQDEQTARTTALKFWSNNPRVPHLIGRKLSQKYRFAEGSALQREALAFDPDYLPAKAQLAEDLLRLGDESEGWKLADEVQHLDGYDKAVFNLMNLHDAMQKFSTLTNEHFEVRMDPREAELYGPNVLELLEQVRSRVCPKYGFELNQRVLVEVFNHQSDFAVRTFGMPENDGFLGVCFGHVITANSPASRPGQPFNWQAMLWHEFTHVVTLNLTRNKMPRWLSEGISVYEEHLANPAWGEKINPKYREMILDGELTPVSGLSAAFLTPETPVHLQFAYYESALVVHYLVEKFGIEKLAAILRDLGEGMTINEAIEKHTAPMAEVEKGFETYAKDVAGKMAPGLDWEKPDLRTLLPGTGEIARAAWNKSHPTNYYVLREQAEGLIDEKKWSEAKAVLEKLVSAYPGHTGPDSSYWMLAAAHRALGETNEERQVLSRLAEQDDAAPDAYLRLMELASAAQDWPDLLRNARRYLAVNPLVPVPYRFLAQASEAQQEPKPAIAAYRALLRLDPANPAEVHFKLGRQLHAIGDPAAKRQVLQALEEAPRYTDAMRLLLALNTPTSESKEEAKPANPPDAARESAAPPAGAAAK